MLGFALRSSQRAISCSRAASGLAFDKYPFLARLGLSEDNLGCWNGKEWVGNGPSHTAVNPSTGEKIANIKFGNSADYESCLANMQEAEDAWMMTPAPKRGDIVRQIGVKLREHHEDLGSLVSLEMGKIKSEGMGEVQEYIDMCDLAVGMSRQIPGQVLPSEREEHSMLEVWNPLGKIGIISAYNFPCAVHGWNSSVSLICGNTQIWKGASSVSLVAIAQTKLMTQVLLDNNIHGGVATLCQGTGSVVGQQLIDDPRLKLVSFTGSTSIGRTVASSVSSRFGRTILELGGNNAVIIMDDAKLDVALPSVLFAAAGTAGQRCTTLRRLLVHEKVYDEFVPKLVAAYKQLRPGNPLVEGTLLGPLHNTAAVSEFENGITEIKRQGGKILAGGARIAPADLPDDLKKGHYVWPTLVESNNDMPIVKEELFVPITHILKIKSFEEAVEINNNTPFGLSSAIFTNSMRNTFRWLGPKGSYCGIINVNCGCSGAEIGGAFGGEKDTGAGRESGSDAWKQYMRRGTCSINYGTSVPLAQGVNFNISSEHDNTI
jgi:aldehyde dehydrogenase family 7 protein A1